MGQTWAREDENKDLNIRLGSWKLIVALSNVAFVQWVQERQLEEDSGEIWF